MEQEKPRNRRRKKKKRGAWPVLLLLVLALIVVAMSPVCNIREVSIEGNSRVSEAQIMAAAGNPAGKNLFRISPKRMKEAVEDVPYIGTVSIHRVLPNKLRITVEEVSTALYIPFAGKMVCVSDEGKVIDYTSSDNAIGAPVAVGLTMEDYQIGKSAKVKETKGLETALRYVGYLKEHGLFEKVTELDATNSANVKFTINYHLKVEFGTDEEVAYKMQFLKQIIAKEGEMAHGVVNMQSQNPTYRNDSEEEERTTDPEPTGVPTPEPTIVPEMEE